MTIKLQVGKLTSKGSLYPWEPGYVADIKSQMDQLTALIEDIVDQFSDASTDICYEALEPTFELSKKYCPVDTGALLESGYLEKVGFRGKPRVEMGYARGGNPFYAVLVHENLNMRHEPPTKAQWLQAALEEDMGDIVIRIAEGYQDFFKGGG